jgi:hypothetical protein
LSAALYLGGYLLLYLYERFTWGAWGVLVALAASVLTYAAGKPGAAAGPQSIKSAPGKKRERQVLPPQAARPRAVSPRAVSGRSVARVLAFVTLFSIGYRLVERIWEETSNPGSESRMGAWIHGAALDFAPKLRGGSIASTDWPKGLYFSYWSGRVFLGEWDEGPYICNVLDAMSQKRIQPQSFRVDDLGKDLRPFGAVDVLSFEQSGRYPLSKLVDGVSGFHAAGFLDDPRPGWRLAVLSFDPNAPAVPLQLPR